MPTKTWKHHERKTARMFGTERVPMSGAMSSLNTHSDSFHSKIYFEAKYRKSTMVNIIYQYYDSLCEKHSVNVRAVKNVGDKTPVLTLRQTGKRGNLICFHIRFIEQVAKDISVVTTHLQRRKLGIWSLWEDTLRKAEFEEKIPVLSIKKAGHQGFLLVLRPKDLKTVFDLYGKSDKQH